MLVKSIGKQPAVAGKPKYIIPPERNPRAASAAPPPPSGGSTPLPFLKLFYFQNPTFLT